MAKDLLVTQQFVSLLTNHQEVIRSYIISQLPGCSEVRDILQEVNILLWEKMSNFKMGTNFGAWACTVAYYKVLDYKKKQRKNGFIVFDEELANKLSAEAGQQNSENLESKRNALRHCLKKLNSKDKKLLNARYNLSVSKVVNMQEMSSESGRSLASLRVSLFRLRSSLKNCISKRLNAEGGQV